jgi:hypothetical protein
VETYSTIQCTVKVSDRVFTTQQDDVKDIPFKYLIKDSNSKLLCHIIFAGKDNEGISDEDLLTVVLDRMRTQGRAK